MFLRLLFGCLPFNFVSIRFKFKENSEQLTKRMNNILPLDVLSYVSYTGQSYRIEEVAKS